MKYQQFRVLCIQKNTIRLAVTFPAFLLTEEESTGGLFVWNWPKTIAGTFQYLASIGR
jgi:hypothetical protein